MAIESHIDFKEFDENRDREKERHYGMLIVERDKLRRDLDITLRIHELIAKGVSGDLRLNELHALNNGTFFCTICGPEENYSAAAENPLDAMLKALDTAQPATKSPA